jgi:hypothetical protein
MQIRSAFVLLATVFCALPLPSHAQATADKHFIWHEISKPEVSIDHVETRFIGVQAETPNNRIRGAVTVRCSSNRKVEVLVGLISNMAGNPDTRLEPHARVRFDSAPAYEEAWQLATSQQTLLAADPQALLERFAKARAMEVEFKPVNRTPMLAHFDMATFPAVYHQVCEVWE